MVVRLILKAHDSAQPIAFNKETEMIRFTLPDMTCGHCVGVINQTLIELDPDCELEFDLLNHVISVESCCTQDALAAALTEAGYPPAS